MELQLSWVWPGWFLNASHFITGQKERQAQDRETLTHFFKKTEGGKAGTEVKEQVLTASL